jgi:spermidine/putrescine-binding protein
VAGLGGLTVLGGAAAQQRNPWDDLPQGESAKATGLELRTIGLGVSVQNYDTNETNANRNAALWNAGLLQPIPVDKVAPWPSARDLFTSDKALGHDKETGWPLAEIWVDPAAQKEFKLVPQFFNCDSIGYREDLIGGDIDSWGALVDPKYKGKVGILNDSLLTPGWCAGYMQKNGLAQIKRSGNMTHEEVDTVINFLIERKKDGQFRAIWEDYGQCVNMLASGEIWLADAWNPVVEDVKKQGVVCKYAFPKEGFTAWFHGVAVAKDTPNLQAALDYVNFCLEGWWARRWRRRATTRRRRPARSISRPARRRIPRARSTTTTGGTTAARARSRRRAGPSAAAIPGRSASAGATSCTGWCGPTIPTTTPSAGTISSRPDVGSMNVGGSSHPPARRRCPLRSGFPWHRRT